MFEVALVLQGALVNLAVRFAGCRGKFAYAIDATPPTSKQIRTSGSPMSRRASTRNCRLGNPAGTAGSEANAGRGG